MTGQFFDRKTAAFYLTLIGLLILDLVLTLWMMLSPLTNVGTSAYASQKVPAVSDATKPSPFDIADSKRQSAQAVRRRRATPTQ